MFVGARPAALSGADACFVTGACRAIRSDQFFSSGMNSAWAALPGIPQQPKSSPCLLLLSLFSATASSAGESRYHKRAVRYQHDCLSGKRANWNCRLAREWSVSRVEVTKLQVRNGEIHSESRRV